MSNNSKMISIKVIRAYSSFSIPLYLFHYYTSVIERTCVRHLSLGGRGGGALSTLLWGVFGKTLSGHSLNSIAMRFIAPPNLVLILLESS